MHTLLLNADVASIDWSRAQFALTAIYHWLFVPLTLGLALIMGIMETIYYRTRSALWLQMTRFWQRLFGVNFAMGVATGIILEFQFGTNWSNYSWFVGDIFGAPLAIEGVVAFFMESTFVAVMFFGWKKVSAGFHLASTWLTGLGATISAWWILVANAWMQHPVGCAFNPDTMRNEMTSFLAVALSPAAVDKFLHTVISSWIVGAVFVAAVSCWYLWRRRERELAVSSIRVASVVGIVASLLAMATGDVSAVSVGKTQPMKLAAMEALYDGGQGASLTAIAAVNPFCQPDYAQGGEAPLRIGIPYGLSLLATHSTDGFVPGINDLLRGYTLPDGTRVPSVEERMASGRQAITALADYRRLSALSVTDTAALARARHQIDVHMADFGYGYLRSADEAVPYVPVCFYAFRVMVGLGALLLLFFLVVGHFAYRLDVSKPRWLHIAAFVMLPLAYVASEAGWIVAEMGRQPWAIQDLMPTWIGISHIEAGSVVTTFVIFLILFTTLLVAEAGILCRQISKGPEPISHNDSDRKETKS